MKLRVGGKYKTRVGETVEIVGENKDSVYPFDSGSYSYTENGVFFYGQKHRKDLVEEVLEGDAPVIDSTVEATSGDTKDVYVKILEAMLTQDQLDTAGRILGNLSGNTPKDLYEARVKQVMGDE